MAYFLIVITLVGMLISSTEHLVKADGAGQSVSTVCNNGKCNTMTCTNDQPCSVTPSTTPRTSNSSSLTSQPFDSFFDAEPLFDEYDGYDEYD